MTASLRDLNYAIMHNHTGNDVIQLHKTAIHQGAVLMRYWLLISQMLL